MGRLNILNTDEAWEIASQARGLLKKSGWAASLCVVNIHAHPLVRFYMDGARPFTVKIAKLKACHSARVGRRTRFIRDKIRSGDWNFGFTDLDPNDYCDLAGGVPIYDQKGALLGGCGISNLHEDQDEMISSEAVERAGFISDLLNM